MPVVLEDREIAVVMKAASELCPEMTAMLGTMDLRNLSIVQNLATELPRTLCDVGHVFDRSAKSADTSSYASCLIVTIGLISASLSLAVLCNRRCSEITFTYHRAINIADMFYMLFMLEMAVSQLTFYYSWKSYAWRQYARLFGNKLDLALPAFVELLVAWMSVERALCYYPNLFLYVNTVPVAYGVTAVSFLIALVCNIPQAFVYQYYYQNSTATYFTMPAPFGASAGYVQYLAFLNGFFLFRAACIAVGTCATVAAFVAISRKKRQMISSVGPQSQTSRNLIVHIRRHQMLCILQLCECLPLIVTCCMAVSLPSPVLVSYYFDYVTVSFDETQRMLGQFNKSLRILIAKKCIEQLAHAVHFILYILFTRKFRLMAVSLFVKRTITDGHGLSKT